MKGWVKLHRKIQEHWIWADEKYLKYFLTILLNVNHEPKKFPVGAEIFICNPGESFKGIAEWTRLFGCSKKTTIKFFKMLEKDEIILTKTVGKGNRRKHLLSVVNWEEYQQTETEDYTEKEPKITPKGNPNVTPNKNDKNDKNNIRERKQNFAHKLEPFLGEYGREMVNDFYGYWTEHGDIDRKMRFEKEKSFGISRRLATWSKKQKEYEKNRRVNKGDETAKTVESIIARIEQTQY